MGAKATFNHVTRIIKLTEAPTLIGGEYVVNLDVQVDLYGDQKEDWLANPSTLRKVRPPIYAIGGNPTPTGSLGKTFFIRSDWKIEPYDYDQRLIVSGNLFSVDGTSAFKSPSGGTYSVFVESTVSNLVDTTVANLPEIQASTFVGKEGLGISVDPVNGVNNTSFPYGTRGSPCKTEGNVISISGIRGTKNVYVMEDITIEGDHSAHSHTWFGDNPQTITITLDPACDVTGNKFQDCYITGKLDASNELRECIVNGVTNANGFIYNSTLVGPITVSDNISLQGCWVAPTATNQEITVDLDSLAKAVLISNWGGGRILVKNMASGSVFHVDGSGGKVTFDSTCTGGIARVYGGVEIVNNGTMTLDDDTIFTRTEWASAAVINRRKHDKTANTVTLYAPDKVTPIKVFDAEADLSDITPQ